MVGVTYVLKCRYHEVRGIDFSCGEINESLVRKVVLDCRIYEQGSMINDELGDNMC